MQRAVDGGACEDLAYFGDARQDIVAGIALGFECRVELGADGAVELGRLVGLDQGVAAGDEFAHGAVVEVGAGDGGLLVAGYLWRAEPRLILRIPFDGGKGNRV